MWRGGGWKKEKKWFRNVVNQSFRKALRAPGDYPFPSNKYVRTIITYEIKHILIRYTHTLFKVLCTRRTYILKTNSIKYKCLVFGLFFWFFPNFPRTYNSRAPYCRRFTVTVRQNQAVSIVHVSNPFAEFGKQLLKATGINTYT